MKTALVTGAGRRIGRAIALHLAAKGYGVAVHFNNSEADALETVRDCLNAGASKATAVKADLNDTSERLGLLPGACSALGVECLDLVVNSASMFQYDDQHNFEQATFLAHLGSNFIAPVEITMEMSKRCAALKHRGHVVTLLDQKIHNLNTDYVSYTLSKLANASSIRFLAQTCAPYVRVNGVAPGVTLVSGAMSEADFSSARTVAALGESNTVDDIVQAVMYLENASSVTGQILTVDGGQHLIPRARDVAFEDK